MGGSGGGSNTTVTKSDPWIGQQPDLAIGFSEALNNYQNKTPQYYQDSTVAGQSGDTTNAYSMMRDQVTNNPLQTASTNLVQSTLNGDYLNSNPYLDANFKAGTDAIKDSYYDTIKGVASGAESGGRYGSGMQAFQNSQADKTLANNLDNLYANTYYNNYQTERANQNNAVSQAGTVQNQGITNANALGSAGSAEDQYAQSLVDADVNKWNYNQNLPYNTLAQYMGLINGNYGLSSSTSTPLTGQSTLGNILSAGALGLGAYNGYTS